MTRTLPPLEIDFEIEADAVGRAHLHIRAGEAAHTILSISDATDALGDLIRAALQVVTGASFASATFEGEPTQNALSFLSQTLGHDTDSLRLNRIGRLRVMVYADDRALVAGDGREAFQGACTVKDFAHAVLRTAESTRDPFSDEEYKSYWNDLFPKRALHALQAALAFNDAV